MRAYSIGELERLLGEKAHVLRYWEQAIPLLAPRRSESGRREYSEAEVLLFLRVKHLVRKRGMSAEAARDILVLEASGPRQDLRALAFEIRSLLVRSYFLSASHPLPPAGSREPETSAD